MRLGWSALTSLWRRSEAPLRDQLQHDARRRGLSLVRGKSPRREALARLQCVTRSANQRAPPLGVVAPDERVAALYTPIEILVLTRLTRQRARWTGREARALTPRLTTADERAPSTTQPARRVARGAIRKGRAARTGRDRSASEVEQRMRDRPRSTRGQAALHRAPHGAGAHRATRMRIPRLDQQGEGHEEHQRDQVRNWVCPMIAFATSDPPAELASNASEKRSDERHRLPRLVDALARAGGPPSVVRIDAEVEGKRITFGKDGRSPQEGHRRTPSTISDCVYVRLTTLAKNSCTPGAPAAASYADDVRPAAASCTASCSSNVQQCSAEVLRR